MPLPPRLFPGDEELGKRDDDHKPGSKPPISAILSNSSVWQHRRLPLKKNLRRLGIALVALLALYFFFKNMPTDLQNPRPRPSYTYKSDAEGKNQLTKPTTGPSHDQDPRKSPVSATAGSESENLGKHWFNGPIKFYQLAASLYSIGLTRGSSEFNRNVLFAASSLKSAALLLPMACEMSGWKRNHVHFALMGRDDIKMDTLKEINGVKDCGIYFHDARPDYSVQSSDYRMEVSTAAGMGHINVFMHPQAVIVDSSEQEDKHFVPALREKADILGKTLIELPPNAEQNLKWLNRLDSAALKAWNSFSIDILIHAQPAASGSLMRLLKSLWKADYFMSAPPRLTIELPHNIDEMTRSFLAETFTWPPTRRSREANSNQLTLRHRVPQYGLSPDESSTRFVESFWPANPEKSHVLVLSPQAELSPIYFYYLKYAILEYRYSAASLYTRQDLLGISLDLPATHLNDTLAFTPPVATNASNSEPAPFFLWQTPNSNAALYFGDKWMELHSFISQSLASKHSLPTPTTIETQVVSKTYPSWLEYIYRLVRVRGYRMLYSVLEGPDTPALVTLHNELYHPPEEFTVEFGLDLEDNHLDPNTDDFTADPEHHLSLKHIEMPLASASLLNLLPDKQLLPSLTNVPLLGWDGKPVTEDELLDDAVSYRTTFAREIGGCDDITGVEKIEGVADDLFCLGESKTGNEQPRKTGSGKSA